MYDPVYGNHIGVVINNLDPENRGRLQIFIPHLSNNLLPTWNTNLEDISFKSTEVDAKLGSVLERLKNALPWAETAVPSFGGGTAGPTKYDGNSSPLPLVPNAAGMLINTKSIRSLNSSKDGSGQSFNKANNVKDVSEIPENVLKYIYSIGAVETGYQQREAYGDRLLNGINPDGSLAQPRTTYYNSFVYAEYQRNGGNLQAASAKYGDFGPLQFNSEDAKKWGVDYNAPVSTQFVQVTNYLQNKYPGQYEDLVNGNKINVNGINAYGIKEFNGAFNAIKNNTNGFTNAQKLSKDEILAKVKNFDENGLLKPNQQLGASNKGSESSPVQMTDSLAAEGGVGSPSGGGAAAGFFSKPAVGAKVWVFFHGGDVQRPVYFASVMEPVNYQVANQTVASS